MLFCWDQHRKSAKGKLSKWTQLATATMRDHRHFNCPLQDVTGPFRSVGGGIRMGIAKGHPAEDYWNEYIGHYYSYYYYYYYTAIPSFTTNPHPLAMSCLLLDKPYVHFYADRCRSPEQLVSKYPSTNSIPTIRYALLFLACNPCCCCLCFLCYTAAAQRSSVAPQDPPPVLLWILPASVTSSTVTSISMTSDEMRILPITANGLAKCLLFVLFSWKRQAQLKLCGKYRQITVECFCSNIC